MTKVIVLEKPFNLKPYSRKELAGIMQVSEYILKKWSEKIEPSIGEPIAGMYNVLQVKAIVETYGLPAQVVNENYQKAA